MAQERRRTPDQKDYELLTLLLELKKQDRLKYVYYRTLIAYKVNVCPVRLNRPAIRIGALYTALVIVLTLVLHVHDFGLWLMTVAGGSLAGALTLDGILRVYGNLRRAANISRDPGGD